MVITGRKSTLLLDDPSGNWKKEGPGRPCAMAKKHGCPLMVKPGNKKPGECYKKEEWEKENG